MYRFNIEGEPEKALVVGFIEGVEFWHVTVGRSFLPGDRK
jgi:hypothetical protein